MSTPARTMIFVPLREEMGHIDLELTRRGARHNRGAFDERDNEHIYSYQRPNRQTGTLYFRVLGDMGNTRTAAAVAAAYMDVEPDLIILAGLAGSLDPTEARLGDVFIIDLAKFLYADKVKEIDESKEVLLSRIAGAASDEARVVIDDRKVVMGNSFLRYRRDIARAPDSGRLAAAYVHALATRSAPPLQPVSEDLLEGLPDHERARCLNASPRIRTGVVLASEMVVDSQPYIDFLHDRNEDEKIGWYAMRGGAEDKERNPWRKGAIPIVDMESYGFFKLVEALHTSGVSLRGLAVRGVSDLAAGKGALEKASKEEIRKIAVRNAASVTLDLIEILDQMELSGRR